LPINLPLNLKEQKKTDIGETRERTSTKQCFYRRRNIKTKEIEHPLQKAVSQLNVELKANERGEFCE
jgi:hypothetical protein